ncbi:MFS transporter [Tepidiforma sp.]|uniref:MFS transporter n=1 Tax=Tepidiforma sp. TaxID=2682230 RepID=UPI00262F5B1B|nr:MFS transporter [Tepidiforma sp.]MCX7618540.1 MFS transporter [Tepidiforma sp.]
MTHDPLAALRQPSFAAYAAARLAAAVAMTLLNAAILYHVYQLTGSAFQLAFIGLARFLPSLGLTLVGGAVADSRNRKVIVMAALAVPAAASATLFAATAGGAVSAPLIYALVLCVAVAAAFENPARQALLPQLVTPETFPNAIVVSSTIQSLGFVTGPALAGLCIALAGVEAAYAVHAVLVLLAIGLTALLRPRPVAGPRRAVSLAAIREGLEFVIRRQPIVGAMTLDMFAVIFGGAQALLPIYATDILGVGGVGYGILAASLEAGALLMSVCLIFLPPIRPAGRVLLVTVALFGLGTILFGLSRNFYLSVATYAAIGMADQVSVVLRQTIIQLATPDDLRGRVSSVNMLFIGASNQLGAVESGLVAGLTNATFAVVSGGIGTLAVVAIVAARLPGLRRYRIDPQVRAG